MLGSPQASSEKSPIRTASGGTLLLIVTCVFGLGSWRRLTSAARLSTALVRSRTAAVRAAMSDTSGGGKVPSAKSMDGCVIVILFLLGRGLGRGAASGAAPPSAWPRGI